MTAPSTAVCYNCSAPLDGGERFCQECGAQVSGISGIRNGGSSSWPVTNAALGSGWDGILGRLRAATFGEYEIGRELGRGGMAAVFLANDLRLNRHVAIKVMAPGVMLGDGMIERFRQEAVTVANLQHAHIVTIHEVRQLHDLHFFVMQYIEGLSLEGALRTSGTLSVDVTRAILYQIGSALAYAHRRGVIHRDVKPGNVLLDGDGNALVADFGISKVAEGPTNTVTGMAVGTPAYMSPEQCFAEPLSGASDQYALGIMAYQMLVGKVPFSGAPFAIMAGHTKEPVPSLHLAAPHVPADMERAVMRMLEKAPSDRYATLTAALAALGAHAISEDSPTREALIRLSGIEERRASLGEVLRTPMHPTPGGRASGEQRKVSGTPLRSTPIANAPIPGASDARTPSSRATIPTAPTRLVVSAAPALFEIGEEFTAQVSAAPEAIIRDVTWESDAPAVARVNARTGVIVGVASGTARITVHANDTSSHFQLTVLEPAVSTLFLCAPSDEIEVGKTLVLTVSMQDRRGQSIKRPVRWSHVGRAIRPGASDGAYVAVESGTATVTVNCGDATDSITLEARAPRMSKPSVTVPDPLPELLIASYDGEPPAQAAPRVEEKGAATTTPPRPSHDANAPIRRAGASGRGLAVAGLVALVSGAILWKTLDDSPSPPVSGPVIDDGTNVGVGPAAVEVTSSDPEPLDKPSASGAVIRLSPPPPRVMRPGETFRLRAVVRDDATDSLLPGVITFTTSARRVARVGETSGEITALSPGRATIEIRGPSGAKSSMALVVRERGAAEPPQAVEAGAEPVLSLEPRKPAATSTEAGSKPIVSVGAVPANTGLVKPSVDTSPRRTVSELTSDDIARSVDRFVAQIRGEASRSPDLASFFADGADHRAIRSGGVTSTSDESSGGMRVRFDVRLTKFNAGGSKIMRDATVTMDLVKNGSAARVEAVSIGALRRP